jgi:hypothetical protein
VLPIRGLDHIVAGMNASLTSPALKVCMRRWVNEDL